MTGREILESIQDVDFYQIAIYGGVKCVHISCYFFRRDTEDCDGEGRPLDWACTEGTFCMAPIDEFVKNFAEKGYDYVQGDLWEHTKQYQEDMTLGEAELQARHMIGRHKPLSYSSITEDTPCGLYVDAS